MTHEEIEACRNLLWWHGDREYGWEPGGFTNALISAMVRADQENLFKLLVAFPHFTPGVMALQMEGIDRLVDVVREEVANG